MNNKFLFTEEAAEFICDYIKENDAEIDNKRAVAKLTLAAQDLLLEVLDEEEPIPTGTPFAVGDMVGDIYFATNKTASDIKAILASLPYTSTSAGSEILIHIAEDEEQDPISLICAFPLKEMFDEGTPEYIEYENEYSIKVVDFREESDIYLFASKAFSTEYGTAVEGWQNLTAGKYVVSPTTPILYIDPEQGWNGIIISKTSF